MIRAPLDRAPGDPRFLRPDVERPGSSSRDDRADLINTVACQAGPSSWLKERPFPSGYIFAAFPEAIFIFAISSVFRFAHA